MNINGIRTSAVYVRGLDFHVGVVSRSLFPLTHLQITAGEQSHRHSHPAAGFNGGRENTRRARTARRGRAVEPSARNGAL